MRQKKSSKIILIIIILLVILISLVGVTYAYFATDIFKSNKDLFLKYITQMGDNNDGFIEPQLNEYFEKQKNTPYSDDGTISINITDSDNKEQYKNTNNMNVTYTGQVDMKNSYTKQNISLNYSNSVKFPLYYKQIGDIIGIQTSYIGSKYIAIDTSEDNDDIIDELQELESFQELTNLQITEEDIQYIKETYFNIINQQLQDSYFTKIEQANEKGYKLTLNGETIKNIIVKSLETLKDDSETLNKINEYIKRQKNSLKITTSDIDDAINYIKDNDNLNDEKIEITVYQTSGKTNKLIIKSNDVEIKIEKIITGNDLQYNIELEINNNNETNKIGFIAKFSGLQLMQSITENYELTIELDETKYQYNYNNSVEFVDSINQEKFDDDNSLILNEIDEQTRTTFINAIIERIQNVNKSQMEQLGLEEDENPLQYVIPQFEKYFPFLEEMNTNNYSEEEINTFNSKFENYESTNLQGVTVKGLLSTIQLNNESQEDDNKKIKEIHFDGEEYVVTEQNITLLKSSVETESAYRVSFEKDETTGIIYRAVINKK
jgi:hypothetical protein